MPSLHCLAPPPCPSTTAPRVKAPSPRSSGRESPLPGHPVPWHTKRRATHSIGIHARRSPTGACPRSQGAIRRNHLLQEEEPEEWLGVFGRPRRSQPRRRAGVRGPSRIGTWAPPRISQPALAHVREPSDLPRGKLRVPSNAAHLLRSKLPISSLAPGRVEAFAAAGTVDGTRSPI